MLDDLVKAGSDINHKNNIMWTALMSASTSPHPGFLIKLLEEGAEIDDAWLIELDSRFVWTYSRNLDIIRGYVTMRSTSTVLVSSQMPWNESSPLYYLGVCLYDIINLMAPSRTSQIADDTVI